MQVRPKSGPLRDSGVVIIILSKHKKAPFRKKVPQKPLFWKKPPLNVLDDQVDTLSFIFPCGTEMKPPTGLESGGGQIFGTQN